VNSAKLYTHITKLPMSRFIDCDVDGDLRALIIEGEPSGKELAEAWEGIQEQYASAIGDSEQRLYLSLLKEVNGLSITLHLIETLVVALRSAYVERFANELGQALKTKVVLCINGKLVPDYEKRLDSLLIKASPIRMKHDLRRVHLETLRKKIEGRGEGKSSREHYQEIITALSNHAGYELQEDTLTVYKYCIRIKELNRFIDHSQKRK
jgi:hypothetical protein